MPANCEGTHVGAGAGARAGAGGGEGTRGGEEEEEGREDGEDGEEEASRGSTEGGGAWGTAADAASLLELFATPRFGRPTPSILLESGMG